ncbi:SRPBCC family protein [Micromonospora sp. CP22]|uniref:SRPBCC family protein n=1 Tax=Micromonospora sp. CP22 TaxID=2580517 RepID=UPI001E5619FF|nr:SRPBCC family protein [Micromonospora sp. CP22]
MSGERTTMDLRFKVAGRISRGVHEVFEAVVDPDQLSQYFTTGGAKGRLVTGATVTWDFAELPGAFPVEVVEVEQDRRIVLRWEAADDAQSTSDEPVTGASYFTTVTIEFEALGDDRTLVTIAEEGWRPTPGGQRASYGNCEGWTNMLCCLKAWLEHGINLRAGFFA